MKESQTVSTQKPQNINSGFSAFELKESFSVWLNDTEIVLSHRNIDQVFLEDIYISLDTEFDDRTSDISTIKSTELMIDEPGHYHLLGEEQQGKTTFLKHAYVSFLKKSILPVYLKGELITKFELQKTILSALKDQYQTIDYEKFQAQSHKVILVDNFDKISLNHKFKNKFVQEIKANFDWVIITSHDTIEYASAEIYSLSDFKERRLLEVGNLKREELAKKWISIGVKESIEDSDLYPQVDELKKQLDSVIKKIWFQESLYTFCCSFNRLKLINRIMLNSLHMGIAISS